MELTVRLGNYLWRPLRNDAADTAFVLSLRNSSRFSKWYYQQNITPDAHARFLAGGERAREINWIIQNGEKLVGVSAIYHIDTANRKAECGRIAALSPRAFPMNFVVSGRVVFEMLNLNKAFIETLESNRIVRRGVERLGMRCEGVLRQHVLNAERPVDIAYYGILSSEWEAVRNNHYLRYGKPEILKSDL